MLVLTALFTFAATSLPASSRKISPLQTSADFSRSSSANPWSTYVQTADGRRAYRLFFEAEYNTDRVLIGVHLVLTPSRGRTVESNLLEPRKNWHGLQPYDFVAADLAQGIDKSAFGAHRMIKAANPDVVVQIDVLSASVSRAAGGEYQIDELKILLSVDNAKPKD
ncbi:MAG: hypothetical protein WCB14_09170 [Candidatus Acidiferrales bacterium]